MKGERKIGYSIVGKTKAGTFCSQGFCSSLEIAIDFWIKSYPRFNGYGKIKRKIGECLEGGLVISNPAEDETILEFKNNKELKMQNEEK